MAVGSSSLVALLIFPVSKITFVLLTFLISDSTLKPVSLFGEFLSLLLSLELIDFS